MPTSQRQIFKTFRYRLFPSRTQKRLLSQTLETCRHWYNTCLAERKTAWDERRERIGLYAQLRQVKALKSTNAFAANIHSHILQVVVSDLDRAFAAFFRRIKAGQAPGFPRFRGRGRFSSFGLKEPGNGFRLDGRRLKLSGIGRIPVRWHRPLEGQIKTVRIVCANGKWFACFACQVEAHALLPSGQRVGIDVGVSPWLTTSDGEQVGNPRWYRSEQSRLRVLQRAVARRVQGGKGRRQAVAHLARQAEHVANRRRDYLNKIVCRLVTDNDLIAIEDLQIANMVRRHSLSKSILDAGWGYFRRQLERRAAYAGRTVVAVDPAYTSRTCSNCGRLFPEFDLSTRWVECACGLSLDRDHNAALNILRRAGHARCGVTRAAAGPCVPQEATPPPCTRSE
jgi:putative transposase